MNYSIVLTIMFNTDKSRGEGFANITTVLCVRIEEIACFGS